MVVISGAFVPSAKADEWDKKTVVTITEPVEVGTTVLEPGTYVFKRIGEGAVRTITQIYNADETRLVTTVNAIPASLGERSGHTRFIVSESQAGQPGVLHSWFYQGNVDGVQFPAPKR